MEVHCHLEKADAALIPGMFMNTEIEVQRHGTYALPEAAIVQFGGKQYIFATQDSGIF